MAPSNGPARSSAGRQVILQLDQRAGPPAGVARVLDEPCRGRYVATPLPRAQERIGIDGRPAAGVNLEVQVRRGALGVACAPDEAHDLARLQDRKSVV